MILSHNELEKAVADGLVKNSVNAPEIDLVSVCLRLDNQFCKYTEYPLKPIVPPQALKSEQFTLKDGERYTLPPMGKVLACSQEIVCMPLDLMGFIQTKGSIARGFIMAHPCDGQIDPGYNGKITFEIVNLSDIYYDLEPGMPFASLFLHKLSSPVKHSYSGRYQGSFSPTPMRGKNIKKMAGEK
jgi:dCTP deaminase